MSKESKSHNPPKQKTFQAEHEDIIVKKKLKDFDLAKSRAWAKLTAKYGPKISQEELLSLAQVVSVHKSIELFREYKRRKKMLIQWFDDNYDVVMPFLDNYVMVTDCNNEAIDFENNPSVQQPISISS